MTDILAIPFSLFVFLIRPSDGQVEEETMGQKPSAPEVAPPPVFLGGWLGSAFADASVFSNKFAAFAATAGVVACS